MSVVVYKNRTNVIPVNLGFDVSDDTISSEIREGKTSEDLLIATWDVSFKTDGVDGKLLIILDDSVTASITQAFGYMDMKRLSGGEPLPVFSSPLKVVFKDTVTA